MKTLTINELSTLADGAVVPQFKGKLVEARAVKGDKPQYLRFEIADGDIWVEYAWGGVSYILGGNAVGKNWTAHAMTSGSIGMYGLEKHLRNGKVYLRLKVDTLSLELSEQQSEEAAEKPQEVVPVEEVDELSLRAEEAILRAKSVVVSMRAENIINDIEYLPVMVAVFEYILREV